MKQIGQVNGIPLLLSTYQGTVNLPEQSADTMYVVSSIVRQQNPDRSDLLSPAKLIRDARGVIIGCGAFEVSK